MKKTLTLLTAILIFNTSLFAVQWTVRKNGTGNAIDEIKAMKVDNAGNVYVTGYSTSSSNGYDFVTVKYNTNGVQQWQATYNGPGNGNDVPNAIFVDNAGNVYVTGYSDSLTGGYINNDATTIKYSPQGVQLWVRRYDGTLQREDVGTAIKVDVSGNVFIAGSTTVHNGAYSKKDFLTIKYNAAGVQQWLRTYNGPANKDDFAVGLGLDSLNNVYVLGTSFAGADPLGENDYLTVKYNSSGVQQWTARYNGPISEPDYATAIAVDNAGNSYVTGYSDGNDLDFATIKYNTSGVQQWVNRYDGVAHSSDIAYAIAIDNSGNIYVTGSDQTTIYNSDFRTIKYNSSGIMQWTARYNGNANDNDEAQALSVDNNGNVYITGYINGTSPSWNIATIKYNASGTQQWVRKYDGTGHGNDVGNAIGTDGNGNVYVAGSSLGNGTDLDYITLKYTATGAREGESDESIVADAPILYQNHPNPFFKNTIIDYYLTEQLDVKMVVTDMLGNVVRVLISDKKEAGAYSVEFNVDALPSGCYFCKLSAGNFMDVKRMIVIQ